MRLGIRAQLLAALLLVTVGAIASVGIIAVWQTRQALVAERFERAAALSSVAARIASRGVAVSEVAAAVGADDVVFYDDRGEAIDPKRPALLPSDVRGLTAALAGAPPHAEVTGGSRLVAYAAIPGTRRALRATFALDREIDARLSATRTSLIVLGAIDGLVLLVAAAWIVRSAVVRPVLDLERAARRVAAGDLDARVELRGGGELGRLAEAFDRMTRSLREGRESLIRSEKLAGIGRLAAGVAHEVGNPLAAILGYVETLRGDSPERPIDPELRREILGRVSSETERIHRIIQELLDYSRPPRDAEVAIDLRKVVDAAVSLATAQARGRGVATRIELPGDLPAVRSSPGRLTQVFLNLVLNAIDATDGKGTISIDARREGDRVVVGVSDDGPGVPVEIRDKIFDPFFTTKDPGRGTGLGLAVSQSIIDSHGGRLRLVDSTRGARFEVELPVATS